MTAYRRPPGPGDLLVVILLLVLFWIIAFHLMAVILAEVANSL